MRPRRLFERLSSGAVENVAFRDIQRLVEAFGFELERVQGSHHIYRHRVLPARLNLQPVRGAAKPYQIRQFLELVEQYDLPLEG